MQHIPVLLQPVLDNIPSAKGGGGEYLGIDGTFGRGGHTREILNLDPSIRILAVDQDEDAINFGKKNFSHELGSQRMFLLHESFHNFSKVREYAERECGGSKFDFIFVDLGVSSPQLDEADRGFSFYHDGPLDMRMNRSQEVTAADIVNEWSGDDLVELFQELGEVRRPTRVVAAIVHDRQETPFTSTVQLSEMIARIEGWKKKGHHPATKYFLALRMQVNNELGGLRTVLPDMISALKPGGRLIAITFHSLEDRIAKYVLKEAKADGFLVNKKVIQASWEEKKQNSRARSAKLRVFEKHPLQEEGTDEVSE